MNVRNGFILATSLLAGSACVATDEPEVSEATTHQALTLNDRIAKCSNDPRVIIGKLTNDACVGADLFFRETFGGNGRSCGTCHRVDHNLVIDTEFMKLLPSTDPLFVAEFNSTLSQLEVPTMMRQFGLILENVDGFAPDPRIRFVLRAVPHTLSLATSVTREPDAPEPVPVERTGWSADGSPGDGSLLNFQQGAITQHYTKTLSRVAGTDFRLATSGELTRIEAFMRRIGRMNELNLATVALSDAGADAGRVRFINSGCNACHGNAGANASFLTGGNRSFDTGVETARHSSLAGFPHDGGFGLTANGDGSFGTREFNTPPLIEAADTGPFFHTAVTVSGASAHNTSVATTIEQAVAFYDSPAFQNSPNGPIANINFTATEISNVGRFLRALNATFNLAQANKRLDAAAALNRVFGDGARPTERELIRLACIDLQDAVRVLSEVNLNPTQVSSLNTAISQCGSAVASPTASFRLSAVTSVMSTATTAHAGIGSGMNYVIGEGTVAF